MPSEAQFVIKAKGTKILKYQWYKDDQPVKDATRNRLMINPVNVEDAGAYKVGVTNEVGAVESNVATLTLSAASEVVAESLDWKTPFTEWIALEDLSGAQATQYADGDDDGVSNLLEYAFAGNPYQSDPDILPEAVTMKDLEGGRFLALTWRESAEATDVSYRVQTSSDLKVWAEMDLSTFAVSRVENGSHAEVTIYLPLDLASKLFLRLAVITEE